MKLKISAGFSGVISTGSYENMRPSFFTEQEFEIDEADLDPAGILNLIRAKQKLLFDINEQNFEQVNIEATVKRINKERAEFRFYYDETGAPMPSVTSFLNVDKDWFVDAAHLRIIACEGQLRHALLAEWVTTKKMPDSAKDIKGVFTDYVVCKKAGINVDGHGILGFFEKYKFKNLEVGKPTINKERRYGGTPDVWGTPEDNPVNRKDGLLPEFSCLDAKRTADLHENMQQMSCYVKADGRGAKQMITLPISDRTKQGFSKPLVSQSVDKYFEIAMQKRDGFKKRYGV